jgi:DUF4097 and DUF4098 domain-containing protein YvlB
MPHPTRAALMLSLLAAAPLAAQSDPDQWLAQCRHSGWRRDRPHYCEIRETGMRPSRQALTVDPGQNGAVAIFGWDRDSIAVTAKIEIEDHSGEAAADLAKQIRIDASGSAIRASGPGALSRSRHWSVSFDVYVPRHTDLTLSTENGPLSIEDVIGAMDLSTENGPLVLRGVGGAVKARVMNGPLEVRLTGTTWEGSGLDAETVNGPVGLEIPEGYSARLETGAVNGPMTVGFPMTVTVQGPVTHHLETVLGKGGALVHVTTTNGPLVIRRR